MNSNQNYSIRAADILLSVGLRTVFVPLVMMIGMPCSQGQGIEDPRLILNTGGPMAQIRSLAFSNDSKRLYSGGLDKIVHIWDVGWNGNQQEQPDVTYTRPLHWEIARGNRGSIYCIQVSPTRDEMVVGGVGARQQTGDIAIFDLAGEQIVGSLPTPAQRQAAADQNRIGTEGHQSAVVSLSYSPDGDAILSRDERGGMFLWRRDANKNFIGSILKQPSQDAFRFPQVGIFLDDAVIVYANQEADGRVTLVQRNLQTGREFRFLESYQRRVAALAIDRIGNFWASADGSGTINLSSLKDRNNRKILKASLPEITAMAFGGQNLLAVVSNENIDGNAGRSVVDVFDLQTRNRIETLEVGSVDNTLAVTLSPDGRFLATHNEDSRRVLVYRLGASEAKASALRPIRPVVTMTRATEVNVLAESPDGKRLAFGRDVSSLEESLDLETGEIVPDNTAKGTWRLGNETPAGWKVQVTSESMSEVRISDPRGTVWKILLDPTFHGTYCRNTFLFAKGNQTEPIGIAIGTDNINSIFIYAFDAVSPNGTLNGQPRLVRWFRDHNGLILSLLQSVEGSTLYSTSTDRTLKVWRLPDLANRVQVNPPGVFNQQSFWGCDFKVEGTAVVARSVDEDGIAFARGIRDGDRITVVQGYDGKDPNRIIEARAGQQTASQISQTLDRVFVLDQILINAVGPAANAPTKAFVIRPAWLPVVTAIADRRGEWAIWHPDGYFNASAAEGGGLFQWIVNRGQDTSPRVLEGGFLSKQFERPDVIQKLLSGSSLRQALAGRAQPGNDALVKAITETPEVRVVSPKAGELISSEKPLTIIAQVNFGSGDPAVYEVRASIDGVRLGPGVQRNAADGQTEFVWTTQPAGFLNQIEVVATQRGGALVSSYATNVAYRRGEVANPTPYELHILSIASENYRGALSSQRGGFGRLDYPIDDVDAVVTLLQEKQLAGLGKYKIGTLRELKDDQISPAKVRQEIDAMNKKIASSTGPQLLLVYLSGHGTTIDGEYYYVTTSAPSAEPAALRSAGLPWTLLGQAGVKGCRVIYMIDTCHSGTAVDAKSSIRDPVRSGGIVIAAASGREAAQELAQLGHGSFTFSILAGLNGDADGTVNRAKDGSLDSSASVGSDASHESDGIVDLEELVTFVRDFVPKLTAGEQKPSATPSRLNETLRIPLMATAD